MSTLLLEPFTIPYMQRALAEVLVLGALAGAVGVLVVLRRLTFVGDALGPPGSDGDTYLRMIRHNTATIVSNLSGA